MGHSDTARIRPAPVSLRLRLPGVDGRCQEGRRGGGGRWVVGTRHCRTKKPGRMELGLVPSLALTAPLSVSPSSPLSRAPLGLIVNFAIPFLPYLPRSPYTYTLVLPLLIYPDEIPTYHPSALNLNLWPGPSRQLLDVGVVCILAAPDHRGWDVGFDRALPRCRGGPVHRLHLHLP